MPIKDIENALTQYGLRIFGILSPCPSGLPETEFDPKSLVLIGNAGGEFWPHVTASKEFSDGTPDPMDRFSRRVVEGVALSNQGTAFFPFDGPPYFPFLTWLAKAAPVSQSPLGPYVHAEYGPWFGLRGAILLPDTIPATKESAGPCSSCDDKPCLNACPAGALTRQQAYNVETCGRYLQGGNDLPCMTIGCAVRRACPAGRDFLLPPEQANFHMRAFRD